MKAEIKIPSLGESVSQAIVSAQLKPNGSAVAADEEIVELETDKVNQVLYAPCAGILQIDAAIGDTVQIGQVIGYVDAEGAPVAAAPPAKEAPKAGKGGARKMAPEFLAELKAPPPSPIPAPSGEEKSTRKRMSNLRKVIAQRLVEAKNQTAMLTTFNEIDMSAILEIREREKEQFAARYGVKLGFMSFFVKGVVAALKAIPEVNAYIDGEEIVTVHTYDIGVAVATDKGLMVPVIRACDQLTYAEIEAAIEDYAKKARSGAISIEEMRGGSFTITNGGRFGSLLSTPILNPPQSAILGMHAIQKRPVALHDQVVIRPMMYVALSYDHRIIDGREAVLFLVKLKENLEDPNRLLLDI
jgi:2-oxoglutarate dehydrogenase E2 component (dihydrolipoamide succinyltransferase)